MAWDTRRAPYHYEEIAEAYATPGLHNLYGVVAECSVPRPSRGTDFVCNLRLADPSTDGVQGAVEMLVFARFPQHLPSVRRPGDIIRLHRVKVQPFNNKMQMVGKVGGGHKEGGAPFAFCLFHSNPASGDAPYQCSSRQYHWDERESGILNTLRRFVAGSAAAQLAPPSEYVKPIRDLRNGSFVDVVAKVVGYGTAIEGPPRWRVVYVWDGTDALPYPHDWDTRFGDGQEQQQQQQQQIPEAQRQQLEKLEPLFLPLPGPRDPEQPLLGSLMPVVIQGGLGLLGTSAPEVGSWVKLRNIGVRVVASQLQGYFTKASKWVPWHEEHDALRAYQHRLDHNEVACWAPSDPAQLVAASRHPGQPFTPLRQVLADAGCGVPHKYRVLARVLDYLPRDPARWCHSAEQCGLAEPGGGSNGQLQGAEYVYTLKLLLADPTAELEVLLFGSDAAAFFGEGLPPGTLSRDPAAAAGVRDRLQRLLGTDREREAGPWVDVCLKAYYVPGDQHTLAERRRYMIFDSAMTPQRLGQGAQAAA